MKSPVDENRKEAEGQSMPGLYALLQRQYLSHANNLERHDLYWLKEWSVLNSEMVEPQSSGWKCPVAAVRGEGHLLEQEALVPRLLQACTTVEKLSLWEIITTTGAGRHEAMLLDYIADCLADCLADISPQELSWAARWRPVDEAIRAQLLMLWKTAWENTTRGRYTVEKEGVIWQALTGLERDENVLLELVTPWLERSLAETEFYTDSTEWPIIPVTLARWRPDSAGVRQKMYLWWEKFLKKSWETDGCDYGCSPAELWETLFELRQNDVQFLKTMEDVLSFEVNSFGLYGLMTRLENWFVERKKKLHEPEGDRTENGVIAVLRRKIMDDIRKWRGWFDRQLALGGIAYLLAEGKEEENEIWQLLSDGSRFCLPTGGWKSREVGGLVILGQLMTRVQCQNGWDTVPPEGFWCLWEMMESRIGLNPFHGHHCEIDLLMALHGMARQCPYPEATDRLWEKMLCLIEYMKTSDFRLPVIFLAIQMADGKAMGEHRRLWDALDRASQSGNKKIREMAQTGQWEMILRRVKAMVPAGDEAEKTGRGIDNAGFLRLLRPMAHLFPEKTPNGVWSEIWGICRANLLVSGPMMDQEEWKTMASGREWKDLASEPGPDGKPDQFRKPPGADIFQSGQCDHLEKTAQGDQGGHGKVRGEYQIKTSFPS